MKPLLPLTIAAIVACTLAAPAAYGAAYVAPVVAHAGGTEKYPANTLNAFKYALSAGARTLESDVQYQSGGRFYLSPNPSSAAASLPTLDQLLALGKPYGAKQFVELKFRPNNTIWEQLRPKLAPYLANVTIVSFDKQTLLDGKTRGYRTGLMEELGDQSPTFIKQFGAVYLKHHWSVTAARAAKWKAAGIKVYPWTPDSSVSWARFKSYGTNIAGVITNRPAGYIAWEKS